MSSADTQFKKGHTTSIEIRNKIRAILTGRIQTPEHIRHVSESLKGKKKPPVTEEHRLKLSESLKRVYKNGLKSPFIKIRKENPNFGRGENHPLWITDRTKLVKRQKRNDSAYQDWRKQVWLRDNWKCRIANPDCKGKIEAHHILGWTAHLELRYEVNNGITLCHAHHPRKHEDEAKLSQYFQELVSKIN